MLLGSCIINRLTTIDRRSEHVFGNQCNIFGGKVEEEGDLKEKNDWIMIHMLQT